jgi:hypothetical protein
MNNNMQDILKNYYANGGKELFETREELDEGPVGKALATAALALGLQFGQQANAEEVFVYKDTQGQLKAVQQANEVPANTEYSFVVDTDTKKINFLNKPNVPKPEPSADRSHISSNTFKSGIDDVQYSRHGVESKNTVAMDFPYKAHKGRLIVQDSGGKRLLALYVNGQIIGKDMKIKIDNYPTLKNIISQGTKPSIGIIGASFWEEPWRHGNNQHFFEAFLTPEEKAELDRIMKAGPNYIDGSGPKRNTRGEVEKHNLLHNAWQRIKHEGQTMKVEVNLYQRGPVVYEFNISQLFKSGGGNKAHTPRTLPSSSGDNNDSPLTNRDEVNKKVQDYLNKWEGLNGVVSKVTDRYDSIQRFKVDEDSKTVKIYFKSPYDKGSNKDKRYIENTLSKVKNKLERKSDIDTVEFYRIKS